MKKSWTFVLTLLFAVVAWGQASEDGKKEFVILGKINGDYKADKVYLVKEGTTEALILDSCAVINNRYVFKGQKPEFIGKYFIKSGVKDCRSPWAMFFLDADTIQIQSDAYFFAHREVKGGVDNLLYEYNEYLNNSLADSLRYEFLLDKSIHGDEDEKTELEGLRLRSELMKRRNHEIQVKLASRFPGQVYAVYLLNGPLKNSLSFDQLKAMRSHLSPELAAHPYTLELDEFLRLSDFGVGSEMPDISCPDARGKNIGLGDFKGKYILIDFWASWCGPCVQEMPHVVELYKECKGKNFEIWGISLDSKKEAWQAMVKKQGMKWPQSCDYKSWYSPAAKACRIQSIPSTILVSPEGTVIAMNLRGEQLIQKVKEMLKK